MVQLLDQSVTIDHLSDFAPLLSQYSTPDWYLYGVADQAGYAAFVTRDVSQVTQPDEMYMLSKLPSLTVVTWRRGIEDPVREWGQLLAYLPAIRRACERERRRLIVLPDPRLADRNFPAPEEAIAEVARQRGISAGQVRNESRQEIQDWLAFNGEPIDKFPI